MSVLSKEQVENIIQVYNIESLKDVHEAVKDIMKDVLQKTLEAELDVSIGYRKYERKEDDNSNVRNGSYTKNVNSTLGKIELSVPRDREGLHEPLLIKKGQSDISEIENKIISMYGKGMTTRDINDHMQDIYGVDISAEMVSKITDRLLPEIKSWQNRVLQPLYVILYIDAIQFNVKDNGKTVKKAIYIAQGIDADGMRDVLGIWVGNGAESSKYWLSVLTEIRNRGALDILITCIDGLSGFAEAINTVYPQSEIQRCIVHHIRYCCKFVNYKDRKSFCADMKTIYNAPTEEEALEALCKFSDKWRKTYGYAVKSWEDNWNDLSTFFKYPDEIRRVIYTTNPIESLNSCIRKVTRSKRVFPTDDAVLKSVYLATQNRVKKWTTRVRNWGIIWGQISIHFEERLKEVELG